MNDELDITASEVEMDNAAQALAVAQDTLDQFLATANVDNVYGDPIQHGDTMIIPCAEVLVGLGFGTGYGGGTSMAASGENNQVPQRGGGGGAGGGGRTLSRPVAVIVATPDMVRVEPVVDVSKIALAFLTAGGFMAAMVMRMLSPRRAMRELKGE